MALAIDKRPQLLRRQINRAGHARERINMKTKELIKMLQKEDPTGEAEVVVGNQPITHIEFAPGFYDGAFWTAEENNYNIQSITLNSNSNKIQLRFKDCIDLLFKLIEDNEFQTKKEVYGHINFDSEHSKKQFDLFYKKEFDKEMESFLTVFRKEPNIV